MILRPLSAYETLHAIIGKTHGFNCVFVAELNTHFLNTTVFSLRLAQLQALYPLLSSIIQQGDGTLFFTTTKKPIPILSKTTTSDEIAKNLCALLNDRIDFMSEAPVRLNLLHTEKNTIVAITFHHLVIDGISGYEFLHNLLSGLTENNFRAPLPVMMQSVETFFSLPDQYTNLSQKIENLKTTDQKTTVKQLQLPYLSWLASTEALVKNESTVHQLLTAFILRELYRFDQEIVFYRVLHPVDLRKFFWNKEKAPAYFISSIDTLIPSNEINPIDQLTNKLRTMIQKEIREKNPVERIALSPYFIDYYLSDAIKHQDTTPAFLCSGIKKEISTIENVDNVYVFSQMNHLLTHRQSVGVTYNMYHNYLNINFHFPLNDYWSNEKIEKLLTQITMTQP